MSEHKRLVIANRGEIARRILRSAKRRGYRVAVISTEPDRMSAVREEADDVLEVGSFLDSEAIVEAARDYRAGFVHPGYGFLSENAEFARRVEAAGIAFVGPSPESMRAAGNKESAKRLARQCDVETLPALFSGELGSLDGSRLEETLSSKGIRAPYLVKAAGGGGGRGMRTAGTIGELRDAIARASEEAEAGFGDPTVFVERFLRSPRHIEIQVFGDGEGGGVALGERECSIQRRHQKVVEEAPSPVISPEQRGAMGAAALRLVAASRYRGAGTAEFLLDEDGRFYFLEMNTRLQVEHPVTEGVLGIDLVDCQLSLAEGYWPSCLPDPGSASVLEPQGWAIEVRVLAEDPTNAFLPTPGPLLRYREPRGVGVRVDSGIRQGDTINAAFDSLIAKVIVRGASRSEAIERLDRALDRMVVLGTVTNLPLLRAIVRHPDFNDGSFSTEWLGQRLEVLNQRLVPDNLHQRLMSERFLERVSSRLVPERGMETRPVASAAERFTSLTSPALGVQGGYGAARIDIEGPGRLGELEISGPGLIEALRIDPPLPERYGPTLKKAIDAANRASTRWSRSVPTVGSSDALRLVMWAAVTDSSEIMLQVAGEIFRQADPRRRLAGSLDGGVVDGAIRAPMAGKVLEVRISKGSRVCAGDVLFVVESMKMQLEIRSPADAVVSAVLVEAGQALEGPEIMAEYVAD